MNPKLPFKSLRRLATRVFGRKRRRASASSDPMSSTTAKPPMPMVVPRLPLELLELVIDFARGDRKTLLACAMTCRAFLPRSRYNLFHSIDLHRLTQLGRFSGLVASEPRLRSLVKDLHVVPYCRHMDVFATFPFVLGDKLSALQSLHIDLQRGYYPTLYSNFFVSISRFSTITSLEIHRVQFPSLHDFGLLVCSFPRLSSLSCWMVDWVRKSYDPLAFKALDRRLQLKHLYMKEVSWSEELVGWLLSVASVTSLESVSLPMITMEDVAHVERLLDAAGSSLRHLEMGTTSHTYAHTTRGQSKAALGWEEQVGMCPRLLHNTSLESLHLHLYGDGNCGAAFLSQVPSSNVRCVTIRVRLEANNTKLKYIRCSDIDRSLMLPHFTDLEKITFQYHAGTSADQLERFRAGVSARFPLSDARRLIRFEPLNAPWWD